MYPMEASGRLRLRSPTLEVMDIFSISTAEPQCFSGEYGKEAVTGT